jgi:uroporphyrinogen III methyltransferase / synthase
MTDTTGKVYLVGGGPGDPGLLTLRGRDVLQQADAIVYDHLVNPDLLRHAPSAEWIDVGKRREKHALKQEDINRLLIDLAARHSVVVRLKGGDPFVFGRGGEEALALREANIPFEIVPGISAGIAVPAYAGIPVTHRGAASSVTFLTGHFDDGNNPPIDRVHLEGTLVFFMGLKNLDVYLKQLIALGRDAQTPAAAIEWGTRAKQRVVEGTLSSLAGRVTHEKLATPCLVVVGQVADLRESIRWFEERPLFGKRVVVTRSRDRSEELVKLLLDAGADVLEFPVLEPEPVAPPETFDLSSFDWIVFMSVNAVDALSAYMAAQKLDARYLHGTRLCAISRKTAETLEEKWITVDAVPDAYEPQAVADLLETVSGPLANQNVLLPRADIGRSALPDVLKSRGASVTEWQAYELTPPEDVDTRVAQMLDHRPDYIVFGSAAAARSFHRIVGEDRLTQMDAVRYAAIGPVASAAANALGMPVAVEPTLHRIAHLVDALAEDARAHP